jgi:biopolymer transport protein ExbB
MCEKKPEVLENVGFISVPPAAGGLGGKSEGPVFLSQERLALDSRMVFLGTIVSTAPFIGLLGTVLGIIKAFHGLSIDKQAGNMVMAGIAESLIATALGLFIAIPAVAAYNYFVRLIKKTLIASENFSRYLALHFK